MTKKHQFDGFSIAKKGCERAFSFTSKQEDIIAFIQKLVKTIESDIDSYVESA